MEKFSLYDYILNETQELRKDELQRIAAELIMSIYSYSTKRDYYRIINDAIEHINDDLDLELPME